MSDTNETQVTESNTDTASTPAAAKREPAPKKRAEKPAKEPKPAREPKAKWQAPADLDEALAVIGAYANRGDGKALAYAVKVAVSHRDTCKTVRDRGGDIDSKGG